jgi:hypothetical protein
MGSVMWGRQKYNRATGAWSECLWGWDGYWKANKDKTPGTDQIPAELCKADGRKFTLKSINLSFLLGYGGIVWAGEGVIVPINKKGDKTDYSNYRGLSLMSVTWIVLITILLSRFTSYEENVIGDYHCGFRRNRWTIDHIFYIPLNTWEKMGIKWGSASAIYRLKESLCTVQLGGRSCIMLWLNLVSPWSWQDMWLNETCSRVKVAKHVSAMFRTRGDAFHICFWVGH